MLSIFGLHNHPAQYGNILFSLPTLPNCENDANLIVFLELLVDSLDLLSLRLKTKPNNLVFFALSL